MIKEESGPERTFSTGANKQASAGKGTPVLFPGDAYLEIAKHFEDGATHYGARNWEKGIPLSSLIDSLERHIAQEKLGLADESHARAIAWNAVVYLATKIRVERGQLPVELADIPGIPDVIPVSSSPQPGEWRVREFDYKGSGEWVIANGNDMSDTTCFIRPDGKQVNYGEVESFFAFQAHAHAALYRYNAKEAKK